MADNADVGENTAIERMSDFFAARIDDYDEHMTGGGWGYNEGCERLAELVPANARTLLDLGCGTGLELERIFARLPRLSVTGIDLTREMLDRLAEKYADRSVELVCGSYFDVDFGVNAYDCVISCETLHHFSHGEKLGLYKKVHAALKNGGCYIECDYMVEDEAEESFFLAENKRIRAELGIPDGEFYHYDTPFTVEHQKRLLREAGFAVVSLELRVQNTTVIMAYK